MPPVVLERPKMSRQMWESLKSHIVRERHRKKQELEADAEVERLRKERERQEKQNSMTLSETRDQISVLEGRLAELKEEKHQVFLQLKKVLNEDEIRKRQLISQEQTSGEIFGVRTISGGYAPMQLAPGGPQMFLQQVTLTRPPAVYKGVPVSHPPAHSSHTLLPPGALKRSRSPSPPLHQQNNYKFGPFKPPPHAIHSYPHKPGPALQFFPTQAIQQAPPHSTPASFPAAHHAPISQAQPPQGTVFTYTTGAPPSRSPQAPPPGREEQPKHTLYTIPHSSVPSRYVMHPAVEVRTHTPPPQQKFGDDGPKYYPPPTHSLPIRSSTHMTLHPALSIASQGISTGSITSGYPIRTQPSATSFQARPPSPHITYTVPGGGGPTRLSYGHPGHAAHIQGGAPPQQHPNAPRYNLPPGIQRGERD